MITAAAKLTAGIASFIFVFLKAFQQRNVAFGHYKPVFFVSLLMAATEIWVINVVIKNGYDFVLILCVGGGAGLGAMLAMYLHEKIFRGKHQ